jgi:signal transduction histidine kinase
MIGRMVRQTAGRRVRSWQLLKVFDRLSIRRVVFVGFSLILALWVVSGADLVRRVTEIESRTAAVQSRFTGNEELLSTVRTRVTLGSVYLRDAFLDTPDTADYYRQQLQDVRQSVDDAMVQYALAIDSPGEQRTFDQLRAEITDYWDTMMPAVSWDNERRAAQARALIRERVIPKRQAITRILGQIQRLNRTAYEEQQAEVSAIYRAMRWRVWETSVGVLLLGVLVAAVVIRRSGRLELSIEAQRARERENAHTLQRLSARLVSAQEEERRTIARELHDEIGQALTAIKMELACAERALGPERNAGPVLREARGITDHAIQSVRDLSQLLHPPVLDDLGLLATLEWYLAVFSKRTGIATEIVQEGAEQRLADEIEVCLYRIALEALTNIARHAEATQCRLYLQRLPQTVLLTVEDNGKGFDVQDVLAAHGQRGLGLLGVRERATGFGGDVRIESQPGKGTRVTVEVPALRRAPDQDAGSGDVQVATPSQGGA